MKPLGLYPAILSNHPDPVGLDDDYDWHRRRLASQRAASRSPRQRSTATLAGRLASLVRRLRPGAAAPAARRA